MSKEDGSGLYYPDGHFEDIQTIKQRLSYPDKKVVTVSFEEIADVITRSRSITERFNIGQREANWIPACDKTKPIVVALICDEHFGSIATNTELLKEHLDIVEATKNMFCVLDGDDVDNFNATGKWASGMMEDPLPPQIISRAFAERMKRLDDKAKIGAWGFGNHNDFGANAGQDWYDTFLGKFNCPIFTAGGLIHIQLEGVTYELGMTHKYWGTSKLNPTNVCKRYLQFECPSADVILIGHTHQSEGLQFDMAGKDRIGVVGGTYKDRDTFAPKHGIGGRAGSPGWAVALWPGERKMQVFRDIKVARDWLNNYK